MVIETIFWLSGLVVVYVYAGYPLLLSLLARFMSKPKWFDEQFVPSVTLLISAFNEEDVIAGKIENALASEYPAEQLEIIVISDCSDDGTDDIVRLFSSRNVRLVRQQERLGKTSGLNLGVSQAHGEFLVFSDANAIYQTDAIRQLMKHFGDPKVGYVVGNARYVEKKGQAASAESEGIYWKLETWMKQKESEFGSVVGGDGAIYAIRRELYSPLRATDINDLLNPLQIIARNYQGLYEPAAICSEDAGDSFEKEFRRKVRIISRSLNAVRRAPSVLLPWVQPRHWFALMSHKVLRWLAPLFLLTVLSANLLLWPSPVFRPLAILQLAFYFLALTGWILGERRKISRVFYLPYYFSLMNFASFLGLLKFLTGSLSPTWQTIRQEGSPRTAIQK
jgi:cellulose synthase/poly-beta-1,6-N-acetylglucosamine synthase-like glycosyltransferase